MKNVHSRSHTLQAQVNALYDGCQLSATGSILVAVVMTFSLFSEPDGRVFAILWAIPIIVVAILRILDAIQFSRQKKKFLNHRRYLHRFAIGSSLAAAAWGIYFWNNYPILSFEYQVLLLLLMAGITSFAVTALSYHLGVLATFLIVVLLPAEIQVFMNDSNISMAMAAFIPLYFVFQISGAHRANRKFQEHIYLQQASKEREQDYLNLQSAVDHHNVVSVTNVKGEIIYANEKMANLTQYSDEELIGANHRVVKCPEYPPAYWKDMWRTVAKGKVWHDEVKNIAKDGSYYWVDSTIVPFMNDKGKPYQYISIRTDITKAKSIEQNIINDRNDALIRAQVAQILQGQETLKQRMADALSAISKAEGVQIQNKLGVFLLEEGATELSMFVTHGKYTGEFLHKEKCVKLGSCLCGRAAVSGKMIISDDCFTDPDHEHKFDGMVAHGHYIVPLWHHGKILGILFIYTDPYPSREQSRLDTLNFIGDLFGVAIANENVQSKLKQAKLNAEEMAQAKSDFLANMSHEIRTPMNGVLGMLDLLNDQVLDQKSKGYVDVAHGSARMLLNVINDILDISKIESGKLHIEHIEFDLRKTVEDSADLLSKQAHQKHLELSVYIPPELTSTLRGDVLRLQQVLSNLTSNAIKFTAQGDVGITISVVEELDSRITLRFEVKDTGIGIAPEKHDTIFHAFTQSDTSTSREFGGTGLGLAISKSLIEMMGGKLGLLSTIGKGSTFWFELPFDIVTRQLISQPAINELSILTIDDNETNCLILQSYIENWGAQCFSTTSHETGLQQLSHAYAQNRPYDILLLDMQMPGKTGFQVAAQIRQNPAFASLKIVLLSSMGLHQDMDSHEHFDLMLNKPIRQGLLRDAIKTVYIQDESIQITDKLSQDIPKKLIGKVLFVDDNLINQIVGSEMLLKLGLDFDAVMNGQEALDARKSERYDAVLMDCQMPVMDGFEATRQIRQYEQENQIKRISIVALTANAMHGDREKCLAAGMDDYLAKPYTEESLFNTLSRWLSVDQSISVIATDSDRAA